MAANAHGYAIVGLSGIVACLVAVLTFAVLRLGAAARDARRQKQRSTVGEAGLLSAALQEVVARVTAQERATAARAEASERLSEEIISSLTAGLLVVDMSGQVQILNRAGRRVLCVNETASVPANAGPAPVPALERSASVAPLFAVIDECLKTGMTAVRQTISLPDAGNGVHLGVTVSPLFDGKGQLHGAICLFTDLTIVRALEQQLRLKESLATVGELTAGIAHEFRNGLATIHGYSKLLDLDGLPQAYRPYVEGIRAETVSLSEVVTNFLNFARPAELTLTRVDVATICERAADELRGDVRATGGELIVQGTFGTCDGDEVLLRQAFSNLLRNAVDACASSSGPAAITIESELDEAAGVSRIRVHDNGPGIPPALRDRVFQPFVTSKRSGTGLGLALVQKIIVFHNGRIGVGTGPLGGASFHITLPLSQLETSGRL